MYLFLLSVIFFAIVKDRKWFVLSLIGFTLNLWFVFPFLYPVFSKPVEAGMMSEVPLRVMMSNVLTSNSDKDTLVNLVRTLQPDIVVLLEINQQWVKSLEDLEDIYTFKRFIPEDNNFGIGIMSKYPLENMKVMRFSHLSIPSIVADVRFMENKTVHIVATHPLPPISLNYHKNRNVHFQRLAAYMASVKGSKIVVGDFNTTMFSPYYSKFIADSGLVSGSQDFGIQPTWLAFLPFFRIQLDYLFVDSGTAVKHFEVLPAIGSDHFPIFCELIPDYNSPSGYNSSSGDNRPSGDVQ